MASYIIFYPSYNTEYLRLNVSGHKLNSINNHYTAILMITSSQLCVYGCTTAGLDSKWKVPKINTEIAVT